MCKMITIYGYRTDVYGGEVYDMPPLHDAKIEDALISFVKFELGYGGYVSDLKQDDDKIVITTRTQVMSKIDTTIFSGPIKEMMILIEIAYLMNKINTDHRKELVDTTISSLGEHAGIPFILVHAAPLIMGALAAKVALLAVLGAEPNTLLFEELKKSDIKDLCAAWALNNYQINGIEAIL